MEERKQLSKFFNPCGDQGSTYGIKDQGKEAGCGWVGEERGTQYLAITEDVKARGQAKPKTWQGKQNSKYEEESQEKCQIQKDTSILKKVKIPSVTVS